jgi:hypothetical protein
MRIRKSHFGDVHTKILRQHAELRARLHRLDRAASAAKSPIALTHLRMLLVRLASVFKTHLAFEDRELTPRLYELDIWGPEREAELAAEHIEQRTRLEHACALAEEDPIGLHELAGEVRWLVKSLLADMDEEESALAELQRIDDILVEQMAS